jgi:type IV pilus assembly protein PilA
MKFLFRHRPAFTLIELLLVIGIIAILAAVVIVAINPSKQLADARNAQRRSDVSTILNAVYQYAIDNNGNLPTGIPTGSAAAREICRTVKKADGTTDACETGNYTVSGVAYNRISLDQLTGSYIVKIPQDPRHASTDTPPTSFSGCGTYYKIYQSTTGRVTVTASGSELGATITVTR